MRLYHYTCDHGRAGIIKTGIVRPNERSYRHLLWLTDLEKPDIPALGLTSVSLRCNRAAYRITVDTEATPWTVWAHDNAVPILMRVMLDSSEGAQPMRWWVTTGETGYLAIEPTFVKQR